MTMCAHIFTEKKLLALFVATFLLFALGLSGDLRGHGGKHEEAFSSLQALEKGLKLYDRLIQSGKMEESWETELVKTRIEKVSREGTMEFKVSFERKSGKPNKVFIFFSETGEYQGSNFGGQ